MSPQDARDGLVPGQGWVSFDRADLDRGIPARFVAMVHRHPERPAVRTAAGAWSFASLAARAHGIAHELLARRGDGEEPVALLLPQGFELIAAILGTLAAGKIYVPLDPAQAEARHRSVLADCDPALLLTSTHVAALARHWLPSERILDLDRLSPGLPVEAPALALTPDRPAYIYYTSGSTGRPKGVVDGHRNVLHNILRYTDTLRIGSGDRLTLLQSCAFSGAVSSLFSALLNGACSHPIDLRVEGIQGLARRIAAERITLFHGVPTIFRELSATVADLSSLRVIQLEGDIAGARDARMFQARFGPGCTLVNGLGTTECGLTCQYFLVTARPHVDPNLPVGFPAPDMAIEVVDENGVALAAGGIGEIEVRGRYLALGYWRDPERTAARFYAEPDGTRRYRTGDLGRRRPDGGVELLGRKDLQAKLHGQWVDTAAVQTALEELDAVRDAAVVMREGRDGRPELTAFLVATRLAIPAAALKAALASRRPELVVPRCWQWLDVLPQDGNGKIDLSRLPNDAAPAALMPGIADPLIDCWRRILGPDAADPGCSFAATGGDSMDAVRLALLLEESLGRPVPPEWITADTTLADLARRLSREDDGDCLVSLAAGGSAPPLFLFHGADGHLAGYGALAGLLAGDRPVYGLRFPVLPGQTPPPTSLPRLAAFYAARIRQQIATGPCTLAGNCMGGLLALETARHLRAAGVATAPAILIDTAFPRGFSRRSAVNLPQEETLVTGHAARTVVRFAPRGQSVRRWIRRQRRRAVVLAWQFCRATGTPLPNRLGDRRAVLMNAASRYRPHVGDDRAILVCVGRVANQRGWDAVACGGLETILLPALPGAPAGNHVIAHPYVERLAELMRGR